MATYILLMTLTPEGQVRAHADPGYLLKIESDLDSGGVHTLGIYGVLGPYDFVTIVEALDNETVARFSIELGVRAGVHITTLPVIPAARLAEEAPSLEAAAEVPLHLLDFEEGRPALG